MQNNRNFFITIALSVLILTLWQVFYMNPRIESQREAARIEAERQAAANPAGNATPGAQTPSQAAVPNTIPGTDGTTEAGRDQALAKSQRVRIDTPSVEGSINLTGARLDDLKLKHYTETVDKNSPKIELLNPQPLPTGYFAEIGFTGSGDTGKLPGPDTVWSAQGN